MDNDVIAVLLHAMPFEVVGASNDLCCADIAGYESVAALALIDVLAASRETKCVGPSAEREAQAVKG